MFAPRVHFNADQLIARTLKAIETGQQVEASQAVLQLRDLVALDETRKGYLPFILGTVVAHEAGQLGHEADQSALYLVAARYLEEARDRGFPPGHEEQGLYNLAKCLFASGRYGESLPVLRTAWQTLPRYKHELARALAIAYLRDTPANLREALHYEQLACEDPSLTARQRDESRVRQSQIQFRLEDMDGCRATLAAILPNSPIHDQALIIEARILIWEGDHLLDRARARTTPNRRRPRTSIVRR